MLLSEKSEAEKEGGHQQARLPSDCFQQSRKLRAHVADGLRVTGKVWKMPSFDMLSYLHGIISQQKTPAVCTGENQVWEW